MYTGRRVAIFSDVHALLEPIEAILEDIERLGIKEIYSLGDNIGLGPTPCEVIDILDYYNVNVIAGIFEEYCTLGVTLYRTNFDSDVMKNNEWTLSKLGDDRRNFIRNFPHSFDLNLGGKKIALCYFINDVRTDYGLYDKETYLTNINKGDAYKQFLYTNSVLHRKNIRYNIENYDYSRVLTKWYTSARDYPIFDGKLVSYYDVIFQGCIHKNIFDNGNGTDFYTIGSTSLSFDGNINELAFYIVLHEKTNNMGFDIEKRYISYNIERMKDTILKSDESVCKIKKLIHSK